MRILRRIVALAVLVVALDQASKALTALPGQDNLLVHPLRNAAFSLQLADAGRWTDVVAMGALLGVASAVMFRLVTTRRVPIWAGGLLLGGAASNIVDRVLFGSVRDFLVVGPIVINLADVAVLLGATAAYGAWARTRRRPTEAAPG